MVDSLTKEQRSKNMRAIRSKETSLEKKVTSELWRRGLRFRKNVKSLMGKPDIAIKKYKIVVFLDSCFWHSCPIHGNKPKSNTDYWEKKLTRNMERDKEVNQYYKSIGWNIMRIWEHDLKRDFHITIDKIMNFILKSMNQN